MAELHRRVEQAPERFATRVLERQHGSNATGRAARYALQRAALSLETAVANP